MRCDHLIIRKGGGLEHDMPPPDTYNIPVPWKGITLGRVPTSGVVVGISMLVGNATPVSCRNSVCSVSGRYRRSTVRSCGVPGWILMEFMQQTVREERRWCCVLPKITKRNIEWNNNSGAEREGGRVCPGTIEVDNKIEWKLTRC